MFYIRQFHLKNKYFYQYLEITKSFQLELVQKPTAHTHLYNIKIFINFIVFKKKKTFLLT